MSRVYKTGPKPEELERYSNDIPYQYYECLALCAEGKAYADIAEQLLIPIGTVKSRISRARIKYNRLEEARINKARALQLQVQEETLA